MNCNLCGNDIFVNMGSRMNARCSECGSLERTRLLWMYLNRMRLGQRSKVLHLAPEKGLYDALSQRLKKTNYVTADIDPHLYRYAPNCRMIDLCNLEDQPSRKYDVIVHCHVLEHVPCNVAYTLFHLHRMLKNGGRHICVIPFMAGKYDESFQDLTADERARRFGQNDHVRRFGKEDVNSHLGKLLNIKPFDATKDFDKRDLTSANIPESQWKGFGISTVLVLKRNDMKLLSERKLKNPLNRFR